MTQITFSEVCQPEVIATIFCSTIHIVGLAVSSTSSSWGMCQWILYMYLSCRLSEKLFWRDKVH